MNSRRKKHLWRKLEQQMASQLCMISVEFLIQTLKATSTLVWWASECVHFQRMDCWAGESKDSQEGSRPRKKNAPAPEKTARYLVKSLGSSIYVWTIIPMSRFETQIWENSGHAGQKWSAGDHNEDCRLNQEQPAGTEGARPAEGLLAGNINSSSFFSSFLFSF